MKLTKKWSDPVADLIARFDELEEKGINANQIKLEMGCSGNQGNIYRIRNGKAVPSVRMIIKINEAMDRLEAVT